MIQRPAPAFPEALDDDDDDVTWALQTAGVQWKRGAHADAIEWLQRAVESAVDGGHAIRAREIQQQANSLEAALKSGWQPEGSSAAPPQRPAQRNPFLSESADLVHDPYGELAVDIDMASSFQLRSRLPTSALPQKPPTPFSSPAEDVSDEELIEELEDFEDSDSGALAAPRMPFVAAPLESDEFEEDEFIEPDAEQDGDLPTLPPSIQGLAPPGRRVPTVPPRPPNLPPNLSWPPAPSHRVDTLPPLSSQPPTSVRPAPSSQPPPSLRPPSSRPPASVRPPPSSRPPASVRPAPSSRPPASSRSPFSEPPPSVAPISESPSSLPQPANPAQAAWQQPSGHAISAPNSRPRHRPSVPKISTVPPSSRGGSDSARSSAPPSPPPPPARPRPAPPRPPSATLSLRAQGNPPRDEAGSADGVSPRQTRSNRRPSARALALEQKIAAAKALARQRRLDAGLSEEEPPESAGEVEPVPSSSFPLRDVSSHPPDTIVTSPPDSFRSLPPEETTERDLETRRASEPLPTIQRDSAPSLSYGEFTDYDPSTSPSLATHLERVSASPPAAATDSVPVESAPPPSSESEPRLEPSEVITTKHDLAAEIAAIRRAEAEAPPSEAPDSVAPRSVAASSEAPLSVPPASEPPQSTIPASLPLQSEPQVSAVPISLPLVSAPPSPEPVVSAIPISIPLISAAPAAEAEPPAPVEATVGPRPTDIAGIELGSVPGLEDLPEESQQDLVAAAEIHELGPDEEVSEFELALVVEGGVAVMPAIADVAAARANRGELIFSQGHLEPGLPIRVVASQSGAKVASFSKQAFEAAVRDCPWVGDELKGVADRLQTLAGVALGPMGEELDDMLRGLIVQHCEVRRFLPNEVIASAGKPIPGMVIVGAGRIEVVEDERGGVADEVGPGAFLFASQILQAAPAPNTARAGDEGALVLFAERRVAHELMVSVPPLLGIFAR